MPHRPHWCATSDCYVCTIRDSALFAGLREAELAVVEGAIEEVPLVPGRWLYRGGEPANAVFTVRLGLVKLVQYLPNGDQRIVRIARSTDVLGLEALLRQPYQHDAIVVQRGLACRIPVEVLNELNIQNPGLHQELMRRWQGALSEAEAWLTELSTGSARQRVIRLILRLADARGVGHAPLFNRKDMGAMLGVTTESASRAVAELKREGLLKEGAEGFTCDRHALETLITD
ncbi:Crp/Fnr family transcriptional regulator [Alkalilimnicola ehrlichii MLHE-1]|nr:Crp/Fnr family transcriptional regulator [Alkalilimnicola ehrlichii]